MNDIYVSKYLKNSKPAKPQKNTFKSKYLSGYEKSGLNQYFSFNNENYDTSRETELLKSLQQEQIRMHGFLCTYILRTHNTIDNIYGESIGSNFANSFKIEMMPEDIEKPINHNETIMPYGFAMNDTVGLYVAFDRLNHEIKKLNVKDRISPHPGDLIRYDLTNIMLEIRFVEDHETPQFMKGTCTMYHLICQTFNLGQETFDTEEENIDFLNDFSKNFEYPAMDNKDYKEESAEIVKNVPNVWNLDFTK